MNLGNVKRENSTINLVIGPWRASAFTRLDVRMAIDYYGHLVGRYEEISVGEWIQRIKKAYAKSGKRDSLIKALIVVSRDENKRPFCIKEIAA